jgi:hypothetical protein
MFHPVNDRRACGSMVLSLSFALPEAILPSRKGTAYFLVRLQSLEGHVAGVTSGNS